MINKFLKIFLYPTSTPRKSHLIDLGWVPGKLSGNSNDCYSEHYWLVYISQYAFSFTHQSQSQWLFHSSFKPNVFANDFQITANGICHLTDAAISKLSIFFTAPFLFPREKVHSKATGSAKRATAFCSLRHVILGWSNPSGQKLVFKHLVHYKQKLSWKKRGSRKESMSLVYPFEL